MTREQQECAPAARLQHGQRGLDDLLRVSRRGRRVEAARQIQQRLLLDNRTDCRNAPSRRPCMPTRRVKCSKSSPTASVAEVQIQALGMRLDQMRPAASATSTGT